MSAFAFVDGEWKPIIKASAFHEGIGFVELYSIKVFQEGEWKVMNLGSDLRELIGVQR